MTPALEKWIRETYRARTQAIESGVVNIDWAIPEYRVSFSEVRAKAEEMGIYAGPIELRFWLQKILIS